MHKQMSTLLFMAVVSFLATSLRGQYTCKETQCLTPAPPSTFPAPALPGGPIVGEIRTFAFGGNASDTIVKEMHRIGWLECEGQTLDNTDFKGLYKAIGTTWGSLDPKNSF